MKSKKILTRQALKSVIDDLEQEDFEKLLRFINSIEKRPLSKSKLKSVDLGGQFDAVKIRKFAY